MKNVGMRLFLIIGVFALAASVSLWEDIRFAPTTSTNQTSKISTSNKKLLDLKAPKKIKIQNIKKKVVPQEEIQSIDEMIQERDSVNNEPQREQDSDDYRHENDRTDDLGTESELDYDSIQDPEDSPPPIQYVDTDLVICQTYAGYCEPKEIFETKDPQLKESCLTNYVNCIDKDSSSISYPMSPQDAEAYIEKKLESFYQENY